MTWLINTLKNSILPLLLLVGIIVLALPDGPDIPVLSCDISENTLLSGQLPCWNGITPGVTTQNEARRLLTTRYGANNVTLEPGQLRWTESAGRLSGGGYVYIDPQHIAQNIRVVFPDGQLAVADLVNRIGEPEQVSVVRAFSSTVYCAGAILSFSNSGVLAYLYPEGNSVGVASVQSIQSIELTTPEKAKSRAMTDTATIPWQGYTDYCALTDPDK